MHYIHKTAPVSHDLPDYIRYNIGLVAGYPAEEEKKVVGSQDQGLEQGYLRESILCMPTSIK
jgi:hypothetical protein